MTDIIEVDYWVDKTITLFKCEWVCTTRGVKEDEHGFKLVNLGKKAFQNDPFILASQAEQVFYVEDPVDPNWHVVVKISPRDYYDLSTDDCAEEALHGHSYFDEASCNPACHQFTLFDNDDHVSWMTSEVQGTEFDIPFESAEQV